MAETLRSQLPTPGVATGANADYIEALYEDYQKNPSSLPASWQSFFQGFELSMCGRSCVAAERADKQSKVASLIYAYRSKGHVIARLDPLGHNRDHDEELTLEGLGLSDKDLKTAFDTGHLGGPKRAPLEEIVALLRATYCGSIGVEYIHIQDRAVRRWLQQQMEPGLNRPSYGPAERREILEKLVDAELFETFLHTRYRGQKRFSLEGAETLIPAIHRLVELAPELGVSEIVMGMAHRGRLNVLANILDKSYADIFGEFEDVYLPDSYGGDSDVKYHKGFSSDHANALGLSVHLSLVANPSHLEAADPVVEGKARAKQRQLGDTEHRRSVLPFLVHGDAAFAGQGVVAETFNLSQLAGYATGGTVHFVINNQIGFTTLPNESRSTAYCTDVAKMVEAPIFHVNGDDPEAVCHVTELALRFRQAFGRDVVVDMVCYRRHGHNEGDEPAFTQPLMYDIIRSHPSVRQLYTEKLIRDTFLDADAAQRLSDEFRQRLQAIFDAVKQHAEPPAPAQAFRGVWAGLDQPYSHEPVDTAVPSQRLQQVARALCTVPEGFALNPKIARLLPPRLEAITQGGEVDWGYAELLAFGSLLAENTPIRLSGQDSARGTFSSRHAVWQDTTTQQPYKPLNHIVDGQANFCVYNSSLSEASVLGFDYGYSLAEPNMLILWEAQFGDFANGAQVIIDQFITAAQSKWQRTSGICLLLPHGYEGQGPEHSNAYLERYLMACAQDNIQVCNVTTPAQYFHLLRRQVRRPFRLPLVVMSPKSLLRHKRAVSPVAELVASRFVEILDDPTPPTKARRVLLCSGKVYYDLLEGRETRGLDDVAILRVEQLYPLHEELLVSLLRRHGPHAEVLWVQEEPRNRGAWRHMRAYLTDLLPAQEIRYVGRRASASPATGSHHAHQREQEDIVRRALVD
ncbi:MAG: 2-oxoglutarate dehydrogenase E1 component [Pseudomonadota bacterium]